jgi:hypothetical protein
VSDSERRQEDVARLAHLQDLALIGPFEQDQQERFEQLLS